MTRRLLHPGAWWIWAVGVAAAALRTTNPLLLGLLVAAVAFVVAARRQVAPWARSFGSFCKLAMWLVVLRLVMQALFGARIGEHLLVTLPSVQLPAWAAGVSLGGPVYLEMMVTAFYAALQVATVLICFGAVNSLCSPYRLLRSLPAVLYEAGVVVTVALAFAPQTVMAVGRVREARRLRGRPTRGLRGLQGMAMPVLEGALERSVALAASMDTRGYGRRSDLSVRSRRVVTASTAAGLLLICVGVYALLDASAPRLLSLPLLAAGSAAVAVGLFSKGRHSLRTRYRADRWLLAEWAVSASGLLALVGFVAAAQLEPAVLEPQVYPLTWPSLSVVALVGVLAALGPSVLAPRPPRLVDLVVPDPEPGAEAAPEPGRSAPLVDPAPRTAPVPAPGPTASAAVDPAVAR